MVHTAATVAATPADCPSRSGSSRTNQGRHKLKMDWPGPSQQVPNHPLKVENRGFESRTGDPNFLLEKRAFRVCLALLLVWVASPGSNPPNMGYPVALLTAETCRLGSPRPDAAVRPGTCRQMSAVIE